MHCGHGGRGVLASSAAALVSPEHARGPLPLRSATRLHTVGLQRCSAPGADGQHAHQARI